MENRKFDTEYLMAKSSNKNTAEKTEAEKTKAEKGRAVPGPVYVTNGSFEGEVYLQWDAIKDANNYVVEISRDASAKNQAAWKQVDIISDPHYMMQGLKSGKSYLFRIAAILNGRQTAWSEAVTKKVK